MPTPEIYADGLRILMRRPPIGGRPSQPMLLASACDPAQAQAIAHAADVHSRLVLALMDARDALLRTAAAGAEVEAALRAAQGALNLVANPWRALPVGNEVAA